MKPNRGKYRPCSSALYSLTLCFDATFTLILCQEGWQRPALSLFAKVFTVFSCKLPKVTYFQKFAFAKRSAAMKAPVGLLSDRTVLRSKMEGPRPDKFTFAQQSGAMKAPVGNALFVGIKVGRTTLAKVMPYMLMYYAAIILGLLLVTYIPAVSMVLPQVTGLV